jgi:hypothetical protein
MILAFYRAKSEKVTLASVAINYAIHPGSKPKRQCQ